MDYKLSHSLHKLRWLSLLETKYQINWFKKYLHFDRKINHISDSFKQKITSIKYIESHWFLPFINFSIISPKVKRENNHILKRSKKEREICYSGHIDSLIYSYYAIILSEYYEEYLKINKLDDVVLAYRKKWKSNINFAKDIFENIKIKWNCYVWCFDLKNFFGSLDHKILKTGRAAILWEERLPSDHYKIWLNITRYSVISYDKIIKTLKLNKNKLRYMSQFCTLSDLKLKLTEHIKQNKSLTPLETWIWILDDLSQKNSSKWIPQWSPISACLANIYMKDFDLSLINICKEYNAEYKRYSDDMIIITETKEDLENIEYQLHLELKKNKLELSNEKTERKRFIFNEVLTCVDLENNKRSMLQYLGFEFNWEYVYVRNSTMTRYHQKVKRWIHYLGNLQKRYHKKGSKMIYKLYSHLGKQIKIKTNKKHNTKHWWTNFISYIKCSSKENWPQIMRQVKKHQSLIKSKINDFRGNQ